MSRLDKDIKALERYLGNLAATTDSELTHRYFLRWPARPPGFYWQMRWLVALILRGLERIGIWRPDPWPVVLRQGHVNARAKPLLIWAVGIDRDSLRDACDGISKLTNSAPGLSPVLVTDVADFTFFSRLGWLVEYLPRLAGEGEPYEERKAKFLARLYRGAPALPAHVGLERGSRPDDIRRWLRARS